MRSRANSLKHGLRAAVVLPDDLAEVVARRTVEFGEQLGPGTPYEEWLVGQAALASAQVDRCAEMSLADLVRVVERADDAWDLDRRQEAEDLGAKLADAPGRVQIALRRTRHGTEWLIDRWDGLAYIARTLGHWDESQRRLAFDLLGTPKELRAASPKLPADADAGQLEALAREQAAVLRSHRDGFLTRIDEREHDMARDGMSPHEDRTSARLRRYEAESRRALRWALAEFRRVRPTPSKPAAEAPKSKPPTAPPRLDNPRVLEAHARMSAVRDAMQANAAAIPIPPPAPIPAPAPAPAVSEPVSPPAPPRNRRARRALERLSRRFGR